MPLYISYVVSGSPSRKTPDVIICPFNRFSKKFVESYNISSDLVEYIQLAYGFTVPYKNREGFSPTYPVQSKLHSRLNTFLKLNNWTFPEFIGLASIACEKIIPYCYTPLHQFYNCCQDAIPVLFGVGQCYRIRGPLQLASGYGYGLALALDASQDDYVHSITNLHNKGMSVRLGEPDRKLGGLNYDLTFLPTGSHALLPLRAVKYEFINKPPQHSCEDTKNDSYFVQGEGELVSPISATMVLGGQRAIMHR